MDIRTEHSPEGIDGVFERRRIEQGSRVAFLRSRIFFFLVLFVVLLSAVLFFISPRATITLSTRIIPLKVTQNVLVALPGAEVPESEQALPSIYGISVDTVLQGRETYPTSEVLYEIFNAEGLVMLYNNTNTPKTFVPSRLQTETGEVFRFLEEITIPPQDAQGNPGEIPVFVVADAYDAESDPIGNRGNIPAGTPLFFPALSAESRQLYYAEANMGPLTKGDTRERYFLSAEDEEIGQDLFLESYTFKALEQLKKEVSARGARDGRRYELVEDKDSLGVIMTDSLFPSHQVGEEQPTYVLDATVKLSGVVFDREQVVDALQEKLQLNRDERMRLLDVDPSSLEYRVLQSDEVLTNRWLKMSVSLTGLQALDLESDAQEVTAWKNSLLDMITGVTIDEAKSLLSNYPDIQEVRSIQVRPLWSRSLPRIRDQIQLRVKHSSS